MKKKINRVSVCAVAAAASLFTTSFSAMGAGAGVGGWHRRMRSGNIMMHPGSC